MSITAYKIVEAASPNELADEMADAIAAGNQPYGQPFLLNENSYQRVFYQAVTKGTPDSGGVPEGSVVIADGDEVAVASSSAEALGTGLAVVAEGTLSVNLPATVAGVESADTVAVVNSAGADSHNATATVASGAITNVKLAATTAFVDNTDAVTVHNSAGTAVAGSHVATVAAGVLSNVKLAATIAPLANAATVAIQNSAGTAVGTGTVAVAAGVVSNVKLPANVAGVTDGAGLTVPVTGTYVDTITPTVAAGVITGFVMS